MASSHKITLKLSSAPGEQDKRAPLYDFSNICGALRNCLKHVGRCVGKEDVDFAISDLSYGSACLEAEPVSSTGNEVAYLFNDTMVAIEDGRDLDPRLDFSAINCFTGFNGAIRNSRIVVEVARRSLSSNYVTNLNRLLEPTSPALGSVSGRLEVVNMHNDNKFVLYPPMHGEEVVCKFKDSDLEGVLLAVGEKRHVTVYGTLYYAKSKAFPVRVDVDSFLAEPLDETLPTLLDAKGILQLPVDHNALLGGEWISGWN